MLQGISSGFFYTQTVMTLNSYEYFMMLGQNSFRRQACIGVLDLLILVSFHAVLYSTRMYHNYRQRRLYCHAKTRPRDNRYC